MHAGLLLPLALVACAGSPVRHPAAPVVHDVPVPASAPTPESQRGVGPLSTRGKIAETSWDEQLQWMDRARNLELDRLALDEDAAAYLKLVAELFPNPSANEQKIGVEQAKHELGLVRGLAPYSLDSTMNAYAGLYDRLPLCARPAGVMRHCYVDLVVPPPAKAPFELGEAGPGPGGVALWTIHEFAGAGAWDSAFDRLSSAKAIVIDLRDAVGTDPRPILPWLERVTGRAPFKPLRAIRRPADLDPYVTAYAARYVAETRDREVWSSLVGEMPAAAPSRSHPPIAVIVGTGCGPACELVARSLVTYAGATLYGSVGPWGRLDRDEPAVMVLPHSKIEIYFHATEYVLAADIERVTGSTPEWYLRTRGDDPRNDVVPFAARELLHPSPPCSSFPAYASADQIPQALRAKFPSAFQLNHCPWTPNISVQTTAPRSAVDRFVQSCKAPVMVESAFGDELLVSTRSLAALTQIAQSELVTRVDVRCTPPPQPN